MFELGFGESETIGADACVARTLLVRAVALLHCVGLVPPFIKIRLYTGTCLATMVEAYKQKQSYISSNKHSYHLKRL